MVRRHFLLPRLVTDELRLFAAVQGQRPLEIREWERNATLGERDIVCGMPLLADPLHPTAEHAGQRHVFCSSECRDRFLRDPALYV